MSSKLEQFQECVGEARRQDNFLEKRKERTIALQNLESNDNLNIKSINMRNILMAQQVANHCLESKISKVLHKYESIHNAFHTIKTQTVPILTFRTSKTLKC